MNETVNLGDICTIKRCEGSVYEEETIYIQVSATDKEIKILEKPQCLQSKYVCIEPKNKDIIQEYLYRCLQRTQEEFFEKYVGKNINIQVDALQSWELQINRDKDNQKYWIAIFRELDNCIETEKAAVDILKKYKSSMLSKLFV